jgi:leucyl aminopeptidase
MEIRLFKTDRLDSDSSVVVLASKESAFDSGFLSDKEYSYVKEQINKGETFIALNQYERLVFICIFDLQKQLHFTLEEARKCGFKVQNKLTNQSLQKLLAFHSENNIDILLAFTEGAVLGAYKFKKYQKQDEKKKELKEIGLICQPLTTEKVNRLANVLKAVYKVRDLVNEPVSYLTAETMAHEFKKMGEESGFETEILNKTKIESLKMGGLLGVNQGSVDPPTFTIMEWKPKNAVNKKPFILVGKGIVYDTGGLSLKPTPDSMDYMKCDMSGAAIASGVLYSVAANKLPIHVIALAPATDNRPSGNALAPGDIISMMDGTNVEVLNSDAEGRLILADALVYAKKYDPELVIDIATLTGSTTFIGGSFAIVVMGTASQAMKSNLFESAEKSFERVIELPLWDDYKDLLKSDIADIKNVTSGKQAGTITAGKFLERFTSYPWMHFDIASVAFTKKQDSYRGKGGTAFSMRLLYNFFEKMAGVQ